MARYLALNQATGVRFPEDVLIAGGCWHPAETLNLGDVGSIPTLLADWGWLLATNRGFEPRQQGFDSSPPSVNIRHINRGDINEGGCPLCKPRHTRYDEEIPPAFLIEEGLEDYRLASSVEERVHGKDEVLGSIPR